MSTSTSTISVPQSKPAGDKPRSFPKGFIVIFLLLAGIGLWFFVFRRHGVAVQSGASEPTVAIAKAERGDLALFTTLTAEFVPYQKVSVHAKVAGYVKEINVDIGDHVKAGQVIATLEIPEVSDDLNKASAELMTAREQVKMAEANYQDVHLAYDRLMAVSKANPKLVAQQDVDTARSKDIAMAGTFGAAQKRVNESEANVAKMKTLLDYGSITAPFDGVITKRYADTGALVQAGTSSSTQAMPLVDIEQENLLRLVFPVPESSVPLIHDGLEIEITVGTLHRTFTGKVSRYAGKVDRATRTMETEIDVPNADGSLTPGMYASVELPTEQAKGVTTVPLQALSSGGKPTVFVLNREGRLEERNVVVGMKTASLAEIRSGVQAGESVLVGSRTGLQPGTTAIGKLTETSDTEQK